MPIHLLVALGASSSYLSWASNGSPDPTFIGRVVRALDRSGDSKESAAFKACLEESLDSTGTPDDPDVERWKVAAALKLCIDKAIEQANRRVVAPPRDSVVPARVR